MRWCLINAELKLNSKENIREATLRRCLINAELKLNPKKSIREATLRWCLRKRGKVVWCEREIWVKLTNQPPDAVCHHTEPKKVA